MTVSAPDLAAYLNVAPSDTFVSTCFDQASAFVSALAGASIEGSVVTPPANVPQAAFDRAVLETGAELYSRREVKNGIVQFATSDGGSGMRMARDPMLSARAILAPFLPGGFA